MIVFRYDKTFEGLLTVVFDAFFLKIFPDRLIGETDVEPLFTEREHAVTTDGGKSNRVWLGLERKLMPISCNMPCA